VLARQKTLTLARGATSDGTSFSGYEMHMGVTQGPDCARPFAHLATETAGRRPCRERPGDRHYVHGLFADDKQRAAWLARWPRVRRPSPMDELVEATARSGSRRILRPPSISIGCSAWPKTNRRGDERDEDDQHHVGAPVSASAARISLGFASRRPSPIAASSTSAPP